MKTIKELIGQMEDEPLLEQVGEEYRMTMAGQAHCLHVLSDNGLFSYDALPEAQTQDLEEYISHPGVKKISREMLEKIPDQVDAYLKLASVEQKARKLTEQEEIDILLMCAFKIQLEKWRKRTAS